MAQEILRQWSKYMEKTSCLGNIAGEKNRLPGFCLYLCKTFLITVHLYFKEVFMFLILNRFEWCPGQGSNLHAVKQRLLRPSCLPFHHPGLGLRLARDAFQ